MNTTNLKSRLTMTCMLAGMLAAPAAHAQFETAGETEMNLIGLAVGSTPDYKGSSDNTGAIAPILRYQFEGTKRYISWLGANVDANLIDSAEWSFGPMLTLRAKRDDDVDNDVVKRMREVDSEVAIGAFVQYTLKLSSQKLHALVFRLDGAGGDNGTLGNLKATYRYPFSPEMFGTIGVGMSYGNDKYMETYFGVTGSDIALFPSLGGNAYNAKAGVVGVYIPVGLNYIMSRSWMLSGGFRYEKLQGDAKDSPIVSREGDSNQWSYGIGLSYIF